jgi:hypothetical protein
MLCPRVLTSPSSAGGCAIATPSATACCSDRVGSPRALGALGSSKSPPRSAPQPTAAAAEQPQARPAPQPQEPQAPASSGFWSSWNSVGASLSSLGTEAVKKVSSGASLVVTEVSSGIESLDKKVGLSDAVDQIAHKTNALIEGPSALRKCLLAESCSPYNRAAKGPKLEEDRAGGRSQQPGTEPVDRRRRVAVLMSPSTGADVRSPFSGATAVSRRRRRTTRQ